MNRATPTSATHPGTASTVSGAGVVCVADAAAGRTAVPGTGPAD